jgi:hypothetical protein
VSPATAAPAIADKPEYNWCRLATSQYHILHSVRADSGGGEFMLTIDGEILPTERIKWHYPRKPDAKPEPTGAKIVSAHRPKGRVCSRCISFATMLERTVRLDFVR